MPGYVNISTTFFRVVRPTNNNPHSYTDQKSISDQRLRILMLTLLLRLAIWPRESYRHPQHPLDLCADRVFDKLYPLPTNSLDQHRSVDAIHISSTALDWHDGYTIFAAIQNRTRFQTMNTSPYTRNALPLAASTFTGTVYTKVPMNHWPMIEMRHFCLERSINRLFDRFSALPTISLQW
jgi:hypothetical protein